MGSIRYPSASITARVFADLQQAPLQLEDPTEWEQEDELNRYELRALHSRAASVYSESSFKGRHSGWRASESTTQTSHTPLMSEDQMPATGDSAATFAGAVPLSPDPRRADYPLLKSLLILPQNDPWWENVKEKLNYIHTWNVASMTSIAWVIIAYLVTVINSVVTIFQIEDTTSVGVSDGTAVGSAFLWMLPLVIGWLVISPKCEYEHIEQALNQSNQRQAYVAEYTLDCNGKPHYTSARTQSQNYAISLKYESSPHHRHRRRFVFHGDELHTCPIFNYARFFSWNQQTSIVILFLENAAWKAQEHMPVNYRHAWTLPQKEPYNTILEENRVGSGEQIEEYCNSLPGGPSINHWGLPFFIRLVWSSLIALILQWTTIGSAIVILYFTPTIGLGCRSASYLLYACLSTLAFILLLFSSILQHASISPHTSRSFRQFIRVFYHLFRTSGNLLACGNALWIISSCFLQLAGFYDSCYCNVQLLSLIHRHPGQAYAIMRVTLVEIMQLRSYWLIGISCGFGMAFLYSVVFLFMYSQDST